MSTVSAQKLLERARLYLCTPDRDDLEHFAISCVEGGVDIVQLRDKHLDARSLVARAESLKRALEGSGALVILNDRPDLTLEACLHGVHVGQDDAPASLARRILGEQGIIGLSTHANNELESALAQPVDYVSVGPVVQTPTKPGRLGTGLGYVEFAAQRCGALPFFVTGGVTPEAIPRLSRAGATRFVVVRYLTQADAPRAYAQRLRQAIDEALGAISPPLGPSLPR